MSATFIGPVEEGEQEWSLDWFLADCERVEQNPPTPPEGIELIECGAEPRHWPLYTAHVDGMYPAYCLFCERHDQAKTITEYRHRSHRRWWSWRIVKWFARHAYSLGIISGSSWSNACCSLGSKSITRLYWKGKRSYFFGKSRDEWTCLLRYHHRRTEHRHCGLCTICMPCPECGSTGTTHRDGIDCEAAS